MKIHRFIGDFDLSQASLLIKDAELAKQMRSVLKLHTGEKIILSNGKGDEALCELGGYGKDAVSITILEKRTNESEPPSHVILYCAILKRENFELVAQKATEIGVKEIVPLITRRTIKLNLNLERLEKIVREAAEQSGRGVVPLIHQPMEFEAAVAQAQANSANIIFQPNENVVDQKNMSTGPIGLFIGPEGGWDDMEITLAKESGIVPQSLGALVLRGETAAIIASYLFV